MKKPDSEILDELLSLKRNGLPKGYRVGLNPLDELVTFSKGGCTDISGYPFYGKSLLLKEILVSLTLKHNWKHAIYMPDDGIDVMVISNLIQKVTGKTFIPNRPNTISENEITRYYNQFTQNFIFAKGYGLEPKAFWKWAKDEGCDSAVIDSWNYMAHEGEPTSPDYLRKILSYRNMFFQDHNMHSFIIIHCKNPNPMQVKEGNVNRPTVYDMMGGSEWNNNGRNIIFVHKPNKSDYSLPYDVYVDKIKPKHLGNVGDGQLFFDWDKQKFYYMDHMMQEKIFAYGEPETVQAEIQPYNPDEKDPF